MAEGDVELGPVNIDYTVHRLLRNYEEEAQNHSKQHRGSIYMVPSFYRDLSPDCFTPRVVSIGPLHHEDEHLKGFEVQKATIIHNLFHNVLRPLDSTPEQILKECVMRVSGSIDRIKACYIGMPHAYTDSELVGMMVTDACFILAFIYARYIRYYSFGLNELLFSHMYLDMILIENQIPFFVLQDIYECTFFKLDPTVSLAEYIYQIQELCNLFDRDVVMNNSNISSTIHDHILGFLHKSYQNPVDDPEPTMFKSLKPHSVVELDSSGLRFSTDRDAEWPMAMDLEFSGIPCFPFSWSKPTLKMPVLRLSDDTELMLRTLIIYEHAAKLQTCVTSYMYALDLLVETPEDIAKLVKSHVLVNYISSNEEAAGIINKVLKDVPFADFYYQGEWNKMDEYYNAYWPNLIAELKRKYFSNPWSIIALIAGIVLFVLTVVQTVYSVKDSKAG